MKVAIRQAVAVASLLGAFAVAVPMSAWAAQVPIKELLTRQFGWDVNATKVEAGAPQLERNVCTVESGDSCVIGAESEGPGGFRFPESVSVQTDTASPEYGDVYVADAANGRVQVFTPAGAFVTMFGWGVNKKGGNVCAQGEECQAGQAATGGPAGQIKDPVSLTTDPATGDIYIFDLENERVDKYTALGEFLLMVGRGVDKGSGNLCTRTEEPECRSGLPSDTGSTEAGAFKLVRGKGNLLATGPGDTLYVGDEDRLQEFKEDGKFVRNVPAVGQVDAVAVDESGQIYLTEGELPKTIRKLDTTGKEMTEGPWPVTLSASDPKARVFFIPTFAMDTAGRIAASEYEETSQAELRMSGSLLNSSGHVVSDFKLPSRRSVGLVFAANQIDGGFPMYAGSDTQEVSVFTSVPVAELTTQGYSCTGDEDVESDATFKCTVNGKVDAWGVKETEAWFEWGKTYSPLGQVTLSQAIPNEKSNEDEEEAPVPISAVLKQLRPHTTYYYRLAAYDLHVKLPENALTDGTQSFDTKIVPPRVVGEPSSFFVTSSSAVLFAEVNAENASTEYFFEYGEHLGSYCDGVLRSRVLKSSVYGPIGAMLEVGGLQAGRSYEYRLCAVNESSMKASDARIGVFSTPPAALPQGVTGLARDVGADSATISGLIAPAGRPATYQFELGVYAGTATQYGVVSSGSVEATTATVEEALALFGLQPGTTYAYRIKAASGYGASYGTTQTFTTLPAQSIAGAGSPPFVQLTQFVFPRGSKCRPGYKHDRRGRCVRHKSRRRRVRARSRH